MVARPFQVFLFLALLSLSDCRVKFKSSSLYDEYDIANKTKIEIEECTDVKMCVIFTSVLSEPKYQEAYENIWIESGTAPKQTLNDLKYFRDVLAKSMEPLTIQPKGGVKTYIVNDNEEGLASPLVIYAVDVSEDAKWRDRATIYAADDIATGVVRGRIVTILSARPFTTIIAGDKATVGTVFATGFDNADAYDKNPDNCRRVMQTRFADLVTFQINGPIASIFFSDLQGQLFNSENNIKTSLTFDYNLDLTSRGFVTSQGYVGCESGQFFRSSLYTRSIHYTLFSPESHYVHQTVFVRTDMVNPLMVVWDTNLKNFIGNNLLQAQPICVLTHKMEVYWDETLTNSFALVYSYANTDCDDQVLTSRAPPGVETTPKIPVTPGDATTPSSKDLTTSGGVTGSTHLLSLLTVFTCALLLRL